MSSPRCQVHRFRGAPFPPALVQKLHHLEMAGARRAVHGLCSTGKRGHLRRQPTDNFKMSVGGRGVDRFGGCAFRAVFVEEFENLFYMFFVEVVE